MEFKNYVFLGDVRGFTYKKKNGSHKAGNYSKFKNSISRNIIHGRNGQLIALRISYASTSNDVGVPLYSSISPLSE